MFTRLLPRLQDIAIRLTGLSLLPIGALATGTLYRLVHAGAVHDATATESSLAAASFVCLSLGSALLMLGAHIFDQVEVSARWAPRYGSPPRRLWVESDEPFLPSLPAAPMQRRASEAHLSDA